MGIFAADQCVRPTSAQLLHGRSAADASPAHAAPPPRPVYESSFWTSKDAHETSRNHGNHASAVMTGLCVNGTLDTSVTAAEVAGMGRERAVSVG